MSKNPPLIIVTVSNPAAFSGKGSVIVLEYTDVAAAAIVARKIARETGRSVTVRSLEAGEIDMIPAATIH
ncbi:hypothetical protein JQ604_25885 [Bradyrhizobium jicamae]|uniref:hypothetical protein n=1 Tax=Bradyrhizobium jicamae TaxID=280332 RepID=UPI001BAD2FC4|nr:hypothetical protein [Bradyrhizobium jicamae]MBR0755624.1 hypothetical protein [Bradyrhizobium jicamae]